METFRGIRLSRLTRGLAWASLFACAVTLLRVILSGGVFLAWMPWNLLLAWVPYGLACVIRRLAATHPHGSGVLVAPTAVWLLFFPNAPYVITDFVHLHGASVPRFAYDMFLLAFFTVVSLTLGLASLYRVHAVVRQRLGGPAGWGFACVVSLLAGCGVWMGRVLRWNSWDVFGKPQVMLSTLLEAARHPRSHLGAFTFSLAFGLGLLAVYLVTHRRLGRHA